MSKPDIETLDWKPVNINGFMGLIGPLLRSTDPNEKNTYALQTTEQHKNSIGLIHGGVLTSLLDQTLALSAWNAADRQPIVTVEMDTRFLNAARAGDLLVARASIRHATRSLLFVEAEITSAETPVATASAIMKIARKSEKSK